MSNVALTPQARADLVDDFLTNVLIKLGNTDLEAQNFFRLLIRTPETRKHLEELALVAAGVVE